MGPARYTVAQVSPCVPAFLNGTSNVAASPTFPEMPEYVYMLAVISAAGFVADRAPDVGRTSTLNVDPFWYSGWRVACTLDAAKSEKNVQVIVASFNPWPICT